MRVMKSLSPSTKTGVQSIFFNWIFGLWTPSGTVLLAEKILPIRWYLWDSKAQTNRWAFKTLGLANSYQDWFQISFLSPTVHNNRRILYTKQMFARFQLWWMLLEEIPKFHWWIFKMPPAVFSANHNKCDRLSWYHWYHWSPAFLTCDVIPKYRS